MYISCTVSTYFRNIVVTFCPICESVNPLNLTKNMIFFFKFLWKIENEFVQLLLWGNKAFYSSSGINYLVQLRIFEDSIKKTPWRETSSTILTAGSKWPDFNAKLAQPVLWFGGRSGKRVFFSSTGGSSYFFCRPHA